MPRAAEPPTQACSLCQRQVPVELITQHHLKPREKGGRAEHRTPLCRPCHKQLHALFSNNDLAKLYDSIEALRQAPVLQPFLKWIRRQNPNRVFRTRPASSHPEARRRRKKW